jgi:peptide/nickel transport system substrate-binding protein
MNVLRPIVTSRRDASRLTPEDVAFSLLRIRDDPESLWSDSYTVIDTADATDDRTLVIKLKTPSAPFLSTLAMPGASVVSKKGMETLGAETYAENPVASGAFTIKEWRRGDRVILEKNPNFWEADRVQLDGVEWKMAKEDVHWIDLYYSPYINVSRSNIESFDQNPLGRFFLEDTVKN